MLGPRRSGACSHPQPPTVKPKAAGAGLEVLGLNVGEVVRWQGSAGGRWRTATVTRREADGSIGLTDSHGAARSQPVERIAVKRRGARGGSHWEPLTARASRCEQLSLLSLLCAPKERR